MEENVLEYDSLANIPWIIIYVTGKLSIFPSLENLTSYFRSLLTVQAEPIPKELKGSFNWDPV
jgi:hypothetical protein